MERFQNRTDAGRRLAGRLLELDLPGPIVVLALPRGGVPVAAEIAPALRAPLEVFVARKIGAPGHEEFGIGAVAEGSDEIVVTDNARRVGVGPADMQQLAEHARRELQRRVQAYRPRRELPALTGRTVVLVDDGLATGVTAEAALRSLRRAGPGRLLLAVPVCAVATRDRLAAFADEVVCVAAPDNFHAVGQCYADFRQTSDEEVLDLLADNRVGQRGRR